MQLLLSNGMKCPLVAYAAMGTDCAENTIPLVLFTRSCLVTAGCCDSRITALSVYATILSCVTVTKDGVRIVNWIY
jgi:hypothetical protein